MYEEVEQQKDRTTIITKECIYARMCTVVCTPIHNTFSRFCYETVIRKPFWIWHAITGMKWCGMQTHLTPVITLRIWSDVTQRQFYVTTQNHLPSIKFQVYSFKQIQRIRLNNLTHNLRYYNPHQLCNNMTQIELLYKIWLIMKYTYEHMYSFI